MEMSRLNIVGLNKHKNSVMETLASSGIFEMSKNTQAEQTNDTHLEHVLNRQAKVGGAIDTIESCIAYAVSHDLEAKALAKKTKTEPEFLYGVKAEKKGFGGRRVITYDDWYDASAKEYELMSICDAIDKNTFSRVDVNSIKEKLVAKRNSAVAFAKCPLNLDANYDTQNTFTRAFFAHTTTVLSELNEFDLHVEWFLQESGYCVIITGRNKDKADVLKKASAIGLTSCDVKYDGTASQLIQDCDRKIAELDDKHVDLIKICLTYAKYLPELKILYDFLGREAEKSVSENNFRRTKNTFALYGYVPQIYAKELADKIKSECKAVIAVLEPAGDDAPTLIKSSKIVQPYESITNMYAVPAYREGLDPNPFMAIFFFMFFGIMIGDAGYGIVLSIACGLMIRLIKPEKGMRNLLMLMAMGGISAVVWGALFGGIFAIQGIPALWFNPMDEPVLMLAVSIIIGVVQLLFGYALSSAKLFKKGKPLDAILDSLFIFTLFGGIALIALYMLKINDVLFDVGLYLILGSLVGIVLTAGRHKKGILMKILGGFAGLYNLVNLMSDVLSYARLFGLGLASGAIGYAFNVLGGMLFELPIVGYPIGIIILIVLHAFNLGIGILGAYVHNARLQFLEFYGKFFDGGGRLFAPMGENTKYVRFS